MSRSIRAAPLRRDWRLPPPFAVVVLSGSAPPRTLPKAPQEAAEYESLAPQVLVLLISSSFCCPRFRDLPPDPTLEPARRQASGSPLPLFPFSLRLPGYRGCWSIPLRRSDPSPDSLQAPFLPPSSFFFLSLAFFPGAKGRIMTPESRWLFSSERWRTSACTPLFPPVSLTAFFPYDLLSR